MVRSPSSIGSTYTGPLDFLDNQTSFYNIFGLDPDMLLLLLFALLVQLKGSTLFNLNFQLYTVALNYTFL